MEQAVMSVFTTCVQRCAGGDGSSCLDEKEILKRCSDWKWGNNYLQMTWSFYIGNPKESNKTVIYKYQYENNYISVHLSYIS